MNEPARKMDEAPAPQEVPKPKGGWGEGQSLAESEKKAFEAGHEALGGKKMELDKQVEEAASSFKESTTSWWQKTKSAFSRAKSWVSGEDEIRKLEAHLDSLKAGYQKEAASAVAPEPLPDNVIDLAEHRQKAEAEAAMKAAESLIEEQGEAAPAVKTETPAEVPAVAKAEAPPAERKGPPPLSEVDTKALQQKAAWLSEEYDRLAEEVADEGAKEKKVQKWALKKGLDLGPTSESGQDLNSTLKELDAVRAELSKRKPAEQAAETAKQERIAAMGTRVDAAMAAEDEAAAMEAVGSLEKEAAADRMAERQRQWDADKAEHERQRNEKLAARDAAAKREAMGIKTSEDSPTASGEIGGEPAPSISVELGDDLVTSPAPAEEAPAAEPSPEPAAETPPTPEPAAAEGEPKLNPLAKETMELTVKKMDELGLAENAKTVSPEKLVATLKNNGLEIEFSSLVTPQSFHKNWLKAQKAYNTENIRNANAKQKAVQDAKQATKKK